MVGKVEQHAVFRVVVAPSPAGAHRKTRFTLFIHTLNNLCQRGNATFPLWPTPWEYLGFVHSDITMTEHYRACDQILRCSL